MHAKGAVNCRPKPGEVSGVTGEGHIKVEKLVTDIDDEGSIGAMEPLGFTIIGTMPFGVMDAPL